VNRPAKAQNGAPAVTLDRFEQAAERHLDDVVNGFGDFVDLKSTFLHGHSAGVAALAEAALGAEPDAVEEGVRRPREHGPALHQQEIGDGAVVHARQQRGRRKRLRLGDGAQVAIDDGGAMLPPPAARNAGSAARIVMISAVFSLIGFSFLVILLLRAWPVETADGRRAVGGRSRVLAALAIPALFALWTNLHGGFVAGLLLIGLLVLVSISDVRRAFGG